MPESLGRWVILMGLASLGLAAFAATWPEHSELIASANVLAWAALTHALYKSRLPPKS